MIDSVFSALGDPTRRAILLRLRRTPATVTDVAAPFAMSLNAVSKHVKVLERAGLVRRQRRGREHLLSADPAPLKRAAKWLIDYQEFWDERLDRMERVIQQFNNPKTGREK